MRIAITISSTLIKTMPYQDVSPAGQHFMNFSRPLSLAVVASAADALTFELIYGFGEYRFSARDDALVELARLREALAAGAAQAEVFFRDTGGDIRLHLHGDGEVLQFACFAGDDERPWLQGEAARQAIVAMLQNLSV